MKTALALTLVSLVAVPQLLSGGFSKDGTHPTQTPPVAARVEPTDPEVVVEPGDCVTLTAYASDADCDLQSYYWVFGDHSGPVQAIHGCEVYSGAAFVDVPEGYSEIYTFVVTDSTGLQDSVWWHIVAVSPVERTTWGTVKALFR
jgi:hypothetical protein